MNGLPVSCAAPKVSLLKEGLVPNRGRITIRVDGEEGRVCGTGWTDGNARAVCISLGFNDGIGVT